MIKISKREQYRCGFLSFGEFTYSVYDIDGEMTVCRIMDREDPDFDYVVPVEFVDKKVSMKADAGNY